MTNFGDLPVLQRDSGAYPFALGAGLWTLDRLMKRFSTVALESFWFIINGIYMYVCFAAALTSPSHVHQSALPVGSMSQLLILSWT